MQKNGTTRVHGLLRVVSWNVLRSSNPEYTAGLIEGFLDIMGADIVLLQEVTPALAGYLDPNRLHHTVQDLRNDMTPIPPAANGMHDGPAIYISKNLSTEIRNPRTVILPDGRSSYRQRKAVFLDLNGLTVGCFHLCHHQFWNRVQFRSLLASVPRDRKIVIGGDSNMIGTTCQPLDLIRATPNQTTFRNYPFSLDRIFTRGFAVFRSRVIRRNCYRSSDHWPVAADFSL